jgi:hypothetical protein
VYVSRNRRRRFNEPDFLYHTDNKEPNPKPQSSRKRTLSDDSPSKAAKSKKKPRMGDNSTEQGLADALNTAGLDAGGHVLVNDTDEEIQDDSPEGSSSNNSNSNSDPITGSSSSSTGASSHENGMDYV